MGEDDKFTASEGWLHRWKNRHGIRQIIISGERLSADQVAASAFVNTFEKLVKENDFNTQSSIQHR